MARARIQIRITSDDFDRFAILLKNDSDFPDTHSGWLQRVDEEERRVLAGGDVIETVTVHPEEFADYCRACGLEPSLTMLNGFAVAKFHR